MKIDHVFKLAQDSLWDGVSPLKYGISTKSDFICVAISNLWLQGLITEQERDAALKVVRSRLGWCYTLEEWLESSGVPDRDLTPVNVQAHRLAWLKKLELEFSNESEG